MSTYESALLRLLDERGYIHQLTDAAGLDALAAKQIVPGYIGFDATAPSLHIGSLVQIMMLRRLQQAGHKPIVLMGGGTTRIGDPTGRDESRKMLTDETIEANVQSIFTVFDKLLKFGDGPTDAVMVNNHDWLGKLGYIQLLQEVGTHFTINRMLTFDSVRLRLEREQPMTFLEFNYMILQGYDFRHLSKELDVRLQMGGSDQWGNIVNGIELGRRMDGAELFGLTTPLLTTASGAKMGKTAAGAVWLNEDQLPSYDFWQYWRNVDDADVQVPAPLHRPTPRRNRPPRSARRRGNQRRQDRARQRGDGSGAWAGRSDPGRGDRARDLRGERRGRGSAHARHRA
ncbi:MAG: hypothetical protein RLZZ475_1706 [Pseudomonadota bacterium]|jgi:tyrosyl-tRNA synthetase